MSYGIVYGLFDPDTGELRYVGQTTNQKQRWYMHWMPSNLAKARHSSAWIRSLRQKGKKPRLEVLAIASSREELDTLEIKFIAEARARGDRLTNHTNGGGGQSGRIQSEETRRKISERLAGQQTNTPEHMERLRQLRVGAVHTEETKARISEAKMGQPSPMKGRTHTPEARAKNAAAHAGKHVGEKHPGWDDSIDTERDIIARLKTGMTATDVAAAIGKTRTFVQRRLAGIDLASHGIVLKRGSRKGADQSHFKRRTGDAHHAFRKDITTEEIVGLKAKGLTPLAIAEKLGCSETMVRGRLGLSA